MFALSSLSLPLSPLPARAASIVDGIPDGPVAHTPRRVRPSFIDAATLHTPNEEEEKARCLRPGRLQQHKWLPCAAAPVPQGSAPARLPSLCALVGVGVPTAARWLERVRQAPSSCSDCTMSSRWGASSRSYSVRYRSSSTAPHAATPQRCTPMAQAGPVPGTGLLVAAAAAVCVDGREAAESRSLTI